MNHNHLLLAPVCMIAALIFGLVSKSPLPATPLSTAASIQQAATKPEPTQSAPEQASLVSTTQITEEAKDSIGAQIREAEYWFTAQTADDKAGEGIAAPNRGQQMTVQFDKDGLTLTPWTQAGKTGWSFRVKAVTSAVPTAEKARALYGASEWFENSAKGVEHGLTIERPSADPSQPLVFTFPVQTDLHGLAGNENQILFKDASGHTQLRYEQLAAFDADGLSIPTALAWDELTHEITWTIAHQGRPYPLTIDPLITRAAGMIVASDGAAGDQFGRSVSLSGDTLAVGAAPADIGANREQGAVYLFSRNQGGAGGWGEVRKLTASDGATSDFFGNCVSLSGDGLAVGAYAADIGANVNQGAVYVFSRNQGGANQWGEVRKLTSSDGEAYGYFGYAASLSGDNLAVGAYKAGIGANSNQGAVYVFSRNQGGTNWWGERKRLTASDGAADDVFGASVSLSGDFLAVGAPGDNIGANTDEGSVMFFARNQGGANQWGELKKLTASDGAAVDYFGSSVSLSGDTLAVGAWNDGIATNSGQGSVTLFSRNQGGANYWGEFKKLTAVDGAAGDAFGYCVSLSGDSLAVGAVEGANGPDNIQGSVYLFSRNQRGANQWGQVNKLTASNGMTYDRFGSSVALSASTLAVGAYTDSVGANADQGSVTLFDVTQSQWTLADVVSPPTAPAITVEKFSATIAAISDTLVVGAPDSDVVALGGANVGRAYVFTAPQGTDSPDWTLQAVLQPALVETGSRFGASVAIMPGLIAVGAPGDNADRGQAHLFGRNQGGAGNWGEIKRLQGTAAGHRFGSAVAFSEDGWWAIGAPGAAVSGQVTLYERNTGGAEQWGLARTLNYSSPYSPDLPEAAEFGAALAMDGTRLLIGAPGGTGRRQLLTATTYLPNAGFAFVHEKDAGEPGTWGPVARLNDIASKGIGISDGRFGTSVVLCGEYAAAVQPGQGNAVIFHRDNLTGVVQWDRIQWIEGIQAVALGESILAVSRTAEAAVETYRRDPVADFTWKSFSLARDNAVTAATGYGRSLALAGESLFVGAPDANAGHGQLHFYGRQQQEFREITKRLASDGAANDWFGYSIALAGDTLAVGSFFDNVGASINQGSVYLLSRNQGGANQWGDIKKVTASDGEAYDFFGSSVTLSGDTLAVGAPADNIGGHFYQGSVYLFSRNQGGTNQWGELKKLISSDGSAYSNFGTAVSLDGDTLGVGAYRDQIGLNTDQGSVTLFGRNHDGTNQWGELKKLISSDGAANEHFGISVSLSGDTLAVGAPRDQVGANPNQGSVMLYGRNQGGTNQWGELKKLSASDGAMGDRFGYSLSLAGGTLAVGAHEDDIGTNSGQGSVTLFSQNQGGANQWGELKKLTASDGMAGDYFGTAVSLSGDTLAVGSPSDDIGTNVDVGSVTLFARNQGGGNQWGELKSLTASDGAAGDSFGSAVALSGDTLVIGAYADDSGANSYQGSVCLFEIDRALFDEWILEQFGSVSVSNPGLEATVWGDLADPDGDGLKNIAEAYFGLNPLLADAQPLSASAVADSLFTYRWQRALEYRGIQAIPTWSPDLQSWYRSGGGPLGDLRNISLFNRGPLLSNDHDTLEATVPTAGAAKTFFRLEFTR